MKRYGLVLTLISLLLAACSGPRTYAEREEFHTDSRHSKNFAATAEPVCEAARRVLLRDGYIVEDNAEQNLSGAKEFQIEENRHAILRVYATCGQRAGGSTLFVTATEEHFDVKTSRQSTSIGLPLISPISISNKSEADNQVKILGETVTDRDFYERFYRGVQQELGR
ncbi:MAG: DUF2242 domain-containing protein [Gallionella sp.]